jgi:hypothetical protein
MNMKEYSENDLENDLHFIKQGCDKNCDKCSRFKKAIHRCLKKDGE